MDAVWFENTVSRIRRQILQLRALGATHREIASLVYKGEGGDIGEGVPALECEILRKQTELSIDSTILDERVSQIEQDQEDMKRNIPEITRRLIDSVYDKLPPEEKQLVTRHEEANGCARGPSGSVREKARESRRKKKRNGK